MNIRGALAAGGLTPHPRERRERESERERERERQREREREGETRGGWDHSPSVYPAERKREREREAEGASAVQAGLKVCAVSQGAGLLGDYSRWDSKCNGRSGFSFAIEGVLGSMPRLLLMHRGTVSLQACAKRSPLAVFDRSLAAQVGRRVLSSSLRFGPT